MSQRAAAHGPRKRISDDDLGAVLAEVGGDHEAACERLGVSAVTLRRRARALGIKVRPTRRQRAPQGFVAVLSREEIEAAVLAHGNLQFAARALGCSSPALYARAHELGLTHAVARTDDEIRAAVEQSESLSVAARVLGLSAAAVGKRARALGLSPPGGHAPIVRHAVTITAFATAVATSSTWAEVANRLGVSVATVAEWRRLLGGAVRLGGRSRV